MHTHGIEAEAERRDGAAARGCTVLCSPKTLLHEQGIETERRDGCPVMVKLQEAAYLVRHHVNPHMHTCLKIQGIETVRCDGCLVMGKLQEAALRILIITSHTNTFA